jgi:hypothetical protein
MWKDPGPPYGIPWVLFSAAKGGWSNRNILGNLRRMMISAVEFLNGKPWVPRCMESLENGNPWALN